MSAFFVGSTHLSALVNAALDRARSIGERTLSTLVSPELRAMVPADAELGALLFLELERENVRSLRYRYPEDFDELIPDVTRYDESLRFPGVTGNRSTHLACVLKGISCYEYQSCEHPEWEASNAHQFCAQLQSVLIHDLPGYDGAPWGLNDEQAERIVSLTSMMKRRGAR